ncbi:MAG: 23S rRNA (guanosine(2251)-2'-O)-methyltransferase RlmB [Firmicutes bacterium]|nr:23S rRNA (guanosine(2251)-2'-O)-methyltransferase RlmB [Bacillota bacterium]
MIIEGINTVIETLESGATVEKVAVQKGNFSTRVNKAVSLARERGVRVSFEEKKRLDELSATGRHQGIIAFVTEFSYTSLEDILLANKKKGKPLLLVLLDGIQDPHNLGAILRSADASGADGVVIPKHRSVTVTETVIKVSAGSASHVPVAKEGNINDVIRKLKNNFVNVYGADMGGESVYTTDLTKDTAIIIGGEGFGISHLTANLADKKISLPQLGKVNSLNASVATGILLYEAVRQREGK